MNETPAAAKAPRLESVDLLRGVIMIIMALDHTRDLLGARANPANLATTTTILFLTRWITHFCAPVFFLLTGTGAYLSLRKRSIPQLSRFLFTRGIWLIVLDLVVVQFAFTFNFSYHVLIINVLWALGWAMISLSALIYLPVRWITVFGAVLIAGHNLLDGLKIQNAIWTVLHVQGVLYSDPNHIVISAYPLIPWIGVTAVGFGLGALFNWPPERRRTALLRLGSAITVAFIALRAINGYGDPSRWAAQKSAVFTVLSFLNTTKYPPSLLFLFMTLGPALLALALFERGTPRLLRPAVIYGRVPMFYFLLHLLVIHVVGTAICYALNGSIHWMYETPNLANFPHAEPPGFPLSLGTVYVLWGTVVLLMYPLCLWYSRLKQRRPDIWWLSYI